MTPEKEQEKKLERIRNRRSYAYFRELIQWLMTGPSVEEVARDIYRTLDEKHAFGSMANAEYAEESLELALRDMGVVKK